MSSAGWPRSRGCAPCARRRSAWLLKTSPLFPKLYAASMPFDAVLAKLWPTAGVTDEQVQIQRSGRLWKDGVWSRVRCNEERGTPGAAGSRSAIGADFPAEERPQVRDHQEEGVAEGLDALLAAAGRLCEGGHPHYGGAGGHRFGDHRQGPQGHDHRHDRPPSGG